MHYLVTGAQGFLGKHVVNALRKAGATVTATGRRAANNIHPCDLLDVFSVARMVDEIAPDCIVHCAAYVPQVMDAYNDAESANASLQMLDAILAGSSCPVVFVSSMTVYGTGWGRPTVEEDAGDPTSAYGRGKWQAESLLKTDGRPAVVIRLPGLFGVSRRSGLVYNVISCFKHGGNLPQLPDKKTVWAAMHVEDAAESIVKLALAPIGDFEAIHIGYSGEYSIDGFISLACDLYDRQEPYAVKHPRFEFDLTRAANRCAAPIGSLRDALVKFGKQL